jgi:pyridoxine 4-dehydrogenase
MDDAQPDQRFDDQLAAMVKARDDGMIGGVGLSNVSRDGPMASRTWFGPGR